MNGATREVTATKKGRLETKRGGRTASDKYEV